MEDEGRSFPGGFAGKPFGKQFNFSFQLHRTPEIHALEKGILKVARAMKMAVVSYSEQYPNAAKALQHLILALGESPRLPVDLVQHIERGILMIYNGLEL